MIDITLSFDLSAIQEALKQLSTGTLPRTAAAVRDATLLVQRTWLQAANGREVTFNGRVISLSRVSGEYAQSISEGLVYPAEGGDLTGRVTSTSPYAQSIEEGSPARDMKPGLLGGPKARRAKDGGIYNIIPFRHGIPGSVTQKQMPQEIYAQARQMAHSKITGHYTTKNAWGQNVQRNTYQWGDRMGKTSVGWRSRIQPEGQEYTHTTSVFSGMVRMGSPKHSQFMTFRVVSTNSPSNSWWSPAQEPRPIAQAVAQLVEPQALAMIRLAFTEDLAAAIELE